MAIAFATGTKRHPRHHRPAHLEHLDSQLAAADVELSMDLLDGIDEVAWRRHAHPGRHHRAVIRRRGSGSGSAVALAAVDEPCPSHAEDPRPPVLLLLGDQACAAPDGRSCGVAGAVARSAWGTRAARRQWRPAHRAGVAGGTHVAPGGDTTTGILRRLPISLPATRRSAVEGLQVVALVGVCLLLGRVLYARLRIASPLVLLLLGVLAGGLLGALPRRQAGVHPAGRTRSPASGRFAPTWGVVRRL